MAERGSMIFYDDSKNRKTIYLMKLDYKGRPSWTTNISEAGSNFYYTTYMKVLKYMEQDKNLKRYNLLFGFTSGFYNE